MFGGEAGSFIPEEAASSNHETIKSAEAEAIISQGENKSETLSAEEIMDIKKKIALSLNNPLGKSELKKIPLNQLVDTIIEEKRIAFQNATYDSLTKLLKLEPFNEKLSQNIEKISSEMNKERKNMGGALIFIDLNHMKRMNDELGYYGTNDVIQEFASRLSAKRGHDMVMRFGGDEFVMYMHGADPDQVGHAVLERILSSLKSKPIIVENESDQLVQVDVTFAMGVEPVPSDLSNVEDFDEFARKLVTRASMQEKYAKDLSGHDKTVLSFMSSNGEQIIKNADEISGNGKQ